VQRGYQRSQYYNYQHDREDSNRSSVATMVIHANLLQTTGNAIIGGRFPTTPQGLVIARRKIAARRLEFQQESARQRSRACTGAPDRRYNGKPRPKLRSSILTPRTRCPATWRWGTSVACK
jgi:hypothetical protein